MDLHYYKVERDIDTVGWDEYDAFVVAASDENEARALAASMGMGYKMSPDVWMKDAKVELLPVNPLTSGIILGSFNAG